MKMNPDIKKEFDDWSSEIKDNISGCCLTTSDNSSASDKYIISDSYGISQPSYTASNVTYEYPASISEEEYKKLKDKLINMEKREKITVIVIDDLKDRVELLEEKIKKLLDL